MEPIDITASMVVAGDVVVDGPRRLIVLHREDKHVDSRIRFTLMLDDGKTRVHRTYSQHAFLWVDPMGAAAFLQGCGFFFRPTVSVDTQA